MSAANGTATRPPRPVALSVNPDSIPAELRALDQWVVWRYCWSPKKLKWDKPPTNARTRGLASSTDPTTWSTYATALKVYQRTGGQVRQFAGLGVVLTEASGITGIDLDHCRDPQTGRLAGWAAALVAEGDTYAEVSPSGTGVRLFLRGSLSGKGRRRSAAEVYPGAEQLPGQDTPEIEVYDRDRYLTVTGHRLDGAPLAVESRQSQLTELYQRLAPAGKKQKPQNNGRKPFSDSAPHLTDEALLTRAKRLSKN